MNLNLFNRYIGEGGASRPASTHPNPSHWRRIAKAAFMRDGRCRCCGSEEELHAHHITYERWGAELVDDITTLCRDCHETIHTLINARRRTILRTMRTMRRIELEAAGQLSLECVA